MHKDLPEDVKKDFSEEYKSLLQKILMSAEQILDKDDVLLTKLRKMATET
jgi:cation transport regulator ChaB